MTNFLNQPHPLDTHWKVQLKGIGLAGVMVLLGMLLLRPTGYVGQGDLLEFLLWSVLLALGCCFFITLHFTVGPYVFPKFYKEENWKLWKQILLFVLIFLWMPLYVQVLSHFFWDEPFSWIGFIGKIYWSIIIGFFPVTAVTISKQLVMLKKYRGDAAKINLPEIKGLRKQHSAIIHLKGENRNEEFSCNLQDLLFIKAADNYIHIHFLKEGVLKTVLIRSSMKAALESMEGISELFRCHRSYVVNLSMVIQVSGNAAGYELTLAHGQEKVPVSRSLNTELRDRLQGLFQ